jgi:hypothetical protein
MFQHYLLNKLLNTTSLLDSTVAKLPLVASLLYTELLYCQSICIPRACEMYKVTITTENLISDHYQHKINLPRKRFKTVITYISYSTSSHDQEQSYHGTKDEGMTCIVEE